MLSNEQAVRYTEAMVKKKTPAKTSKHFQKREKFEPTKMSLAVAAAAAVCLVLLGVIATRL
jgi:hypothetical protein